MVLDTVAEECLHDLEEISELEQVKCDVGVQKRIEEVRMRLFGELVLDWRDLELLESVRAVVRLCKQHAMRVSWSAAE
jgi:hypothetical protein